MDGSTIALVCVLSIVGAYLLGACVTCCVCQKYNGQTHTMGDGLNPIFHTAAAACWPCLLLGGCCNLVQETCERQCHETEEAPV